MQALPMIMMAASTVMTAAGQIRQGRLDKQVGWANAAVEEKKGEAEFAAKARESARVAREQKRYESSALAKGAKSGMGMSESFINYLTEMGQTGRYNTESLIYEGKAMKQARGHSADLMRWEGSQKKKSSQGAALATVVKGAASMASMYGGGAPGADTARYSSGADLAMGSGLHTGRNGMLVGGA